MTVLEAFKKMPLRHCKTCLVLDRYGDTLAEVDQQTVESEVDQAVLISRVASVQLHEDKAIIRVA